MDRDSDRSVEQVMVDNALRLAEELEGVIEVDIDPASFWLGHIVAVASSVGISPAFLIEAEPETYTRIFLDIRRMEAEQ